VLRCGYGAIRRLLGAVVLLALTVVLMTAQKSSSPRRHAQRVKKLNDVIEHIEITDGVETIGGASMQDAIWALREQTDFPISLELLEFERPRDFITLGEALARLHTLETTAVLGIRDMGRLHDYEKRAQTHEPSDVLFPRQKTFALVEDQITVRALLNRMMTLDDEYLWKDYGTESTPVIVIQPRTGSALEWPLSRICHPRPIASNQLFASCRNQKCGPYTKLLNDHNMSVIQMLDGPVLPGEHPPDPVPLVSVDVCRDRLTVRDVLNLIAKGTNSSWTLAGIKGMRLISFQPSTR
jgi:hypothetical protein